MKIDEFLEPKKRKSNPQQIREEAASEDSEIEAEVVRLKKSKIVPAPLDENKGEDSNIFSCIQTGGKLPDIQTAADETSSGYFETEILHNRPESCILRFHVQFPAPVTDEELVFTEVLHRSKRVLEEFLNCSMIVKFQVTSDKKFFTMNIHCYFS
jgi:hypothetical protein